MKDRLTIQEKIKAFKLFQQIEKGKEFRMEITYSERYLKKIKQIFSDISHSAKKTDMY
jgi:hypothetical protein